MVQGIIGGRAARSSVEWQCGPVNVKLIEVDSSLQHFVTGSVLNSMDDSVTDSGALLRTGSNRVMVTGLGAVTPVGIGVGDFWQGLTSGRNGISRITQFDPTGFRSQMAGEVKDFQPEDWIDRKNLSRMDRFTRFAMAAATLAIEDSGLVEGGFEAERAGIILGSGIGGANTIEEGHDLIDERGPRALSPFFIPMVMINTAACMVSMHYKLKGLLSAPSVACSTGSNAIGQAFNVIRRGDADIMLAGGTESCITPLTVAGFGASRSTSSRNDEPERASRPFDRDRDGFVIGEGAGIAVLESREHAVSRNARIYAEVIGYGNTADAYHLTAPDPDATGMRRVMQTALDDAGIEPLEVGYINAHGTSTVLNDKMESKAIIDLFGEHASNLKISSTKSMVGHLLGAAGGVEFIATVMSVYSGVLHPTINYDEPDPECPLDYVPNVSVAEPVEVAISNSFGFGGCNTCVAIRKHVI